MELTSIQIGKKTLERLKSLKEYRRETYDDLINKMAVIVERLAKNEPELSDQILEEIRIARQESRQGKGISTQQLMRELEISQ